MAVTVYTIPELMPILRLKKRAIRNLITSGELAGRLVGRQFLVSDEALKRYLKAPEHVPCGNCRQ
jgi:excisionase family DNA binding protein